MKKFVTQESLLRVMDAKTLRELKIRGALRIMRPAPCMLLELDSVPTRYLRRLNAAHA